MWLGVFALALAGGLEDGAVVPCLDEVTVRDGPSVKAARLGVVRRGERLALLDTSDVQHELDVTIDRNVPAPFRVSLRDAWLKVALPADAGVPFGWVFGGVMCRAAYPLSERWLTVVGWSKDDARVALIEKATDSFACGWGRPAALRIIDVGSGQLLDSLEDGCPAADLLLARRPEVLALLEKHGVSPHWFVLTRGTPVLRARLKRACVRGRCEVELRDEAGARRAEATFALPAAALDVEGGYPRVEVVVVARRLGAQVAFVRLQTSEVAHTFWPVRLPETPPAEAEAWRDVLPGVHFTSTERPCGSLAATTRDATARRALDGLQAELRRRLKKGFGEAAQPDDGGCVLGASVRRGQLVLSVTPHACVGNECPGEECREQLELVIGPDFMVRHEARRPSEHYSCDP